MYAQLGPSILEVTRIRPQAAYTMPVWWCPFCDCSNQFLQDLNTGGARPCAKCGAKVLLSNPEPATPVDRYMAAVSESMVSTMETAGPPGAPGEEISTEASHLSENMRTEPEPPAPVEAATDTPGELVAAPDPPAKAPRTRGIGPSRRGKR